MVAVPAAESVTLTVMAVVPAVVGVPEMTPEGFNDRPTGNGLDPGFRLHTYPGMPPVAVNVWLWASPTGPPGNTIVLTVNRPAFFTKQFGTEKSIAEGPTLTTLVTGVETNVCRLNSIALNVATLFRRIPTRNVPSAAVTAKPLPE